MSTLSRQMTVLVHHIDHAKKRGQQPVKEYQDNVIASFDSSKRKWLNKKERKTCSTMRGTNSL
jgi:hypothetical protein